MRKILYIILDGLGDQPIKELNDKTPLEAAFTPNMDRLAQGGATGLLYPAGEGVAPESDVAVINLLGYDPQRYYTGRGPLEAFAWGMKVNPGDLALRVNFASVADDGVSIKDRRSGRDLNSEEAASLAKEINSRITLSSATFEFKPTVDYRGVLVISGIRSRLSGWVTNTDPAYERKGISSLVKQSFASRVEESRVMPGHENSGEAKEAVALLNEFTQKAFQVLSESAVNKRRISENKLPANIILSRDAGSSLPQFPALPNLYKLKFGSSVQLPIERGIALLTGTEIIEVPSASGHLDVDYPVWAKVILDALNKYDCVYLHIKGPDLPSHEGDFLAKKSVIETIDKFFFTDLINGVKPADTLIAVTSDHSAFCSLRAHTSDPVPLLISGGKVRPDGSLSFSEKAARLGSLGKLTGRKLLPLLIKHSH